MSGKMRPVVCQATLSIQVCFSILKYFNPLMGEMIPIKIHGYASFKSYIEIYYA